MNEIGASSVFDVITTTMRNVRDHGYIDVRTTDKEHPVATNCAQIYVIIDVVENKKYKTIPIVIRLCPPGNPSYPLLMNNYPGEMNGAVVYNTIAHEVYDIPQMRAEMALSSTPVSRTTLCDNPSGKRIVYFLNL